MSEQSELVENFFNDIVDIEDELEHVSEICAGGSLPAELLNSAFRAVHSLKGTAGFLAEEDPRFARLKDLCHALESYLHAMRDGAIPESPAGRQLVALSTDILLADLEDMREGHDIPKRTDLIARLEIAAARSHDHQSDEAYVAAGAHLAVANGRYYFTLKRNIDRLKEVNEFRAFLERTLMTAPEGTSLVLDFQNEYRIASLLLGTIAYLAGKGIKVYLARPTAYARQFVIPRMHFNPDRVCMVEHPHEI